MSWLDDVNSSLDPSLFWTRPFFNWVMAGSFIDNSKSKNSFRQNHGLKFGMIGTYKSYFQNVKRKGKVIFYHSTTLKYFCWTRDDSLNTHAFCHTSYTDRWRLRFCPVIIMWTADIQMKWRCDHRSCDCDLSNRKLSPKSVFGASTRIEPVAAALALCVCSSHNTLFSFLSRVRWTQYIRLPPTCGSS